MRARVVNWFERLITVIMIICVMSGVILMMCESPDWETQRMTLFGGFGLFCLGVIPGVIISAINTRKEKRVNGNFYR